MNNIFNDIKLALEQAIEYGREQACGEKEE